MDNFSLSSNEKKVNEIDSINKLKFCFLIIMMNGHQIQFARNFVRKTYCRFFNCISYQ